MVAIYVLKLSRGKYYVGMTRKNIDRVLAHIDGKGAAWTKKYPPSGTKPILSFQEGLGEADEDRITLQMMKKYGVKNVRGGQWCQVNMSASKIRELEKLANPPKKSATKSKNVRKTSTKTKAKPKHCQRCGRTSHTRSKCYATTTVDGVAITTKSWEYRPKSKTKRTPGRSSKSSKQCQAKTNYGYGPRCTLPALPRKKVCHVHDRKKSRW